MGELDRLRGGMKTLQEKLRSITATAKSDSRQLAQSITSTIQAATADAMKQVTEACKPYMPEAEIQAHLEFDLDGMQHRLDSELGLLEVDKPEKEKR
jgi:hypothetical protein